MTDLQTLKFSGHWRTAAQGSKGGHLLLHESLAREEMLTLCIMSYRAHFPTLSAKDGCCISSSEVRAVFSCWSRRAFVSRGCWCVFSSTTAEGCWWGWQDSRSGCALDLGARHAAGVTMRSVASLHELLRLSCGLITPAATRSARAPLLIQSRSYPGTHHSTQLRHAVRGERIGGRISGAGLLPSSQSALAGDLCYCACQIGGSGQTLPAVSGVLSGGRLVVPTLCMTSPCAIYSNRKLPFNEPQFSSAIAVHELLRLLVRGMDKVMLPP